MARDYDMPPPSALRNLGVRRCTTPSMLARLSAGKAARDKAKEELKLSRVGGRAFTSSKMFRSNDEQGGRPELINGFARAFASRTPGAQTDRPITSPSSVSWSLPSTPRRPNGPGRRTPYDARCAYRRPDGKRMHQSVDTGHFSPKHTPPLASIFPDRPATTGTPSPRVKLADLKRLEVQFPAEEGRGPSPLQNKAAGAKPKRGGLVRTKSLRVANPLPEGVTPEVPDVANVLEGKEETG